MNATRVISSAWRSLARSKLRSFFMMLGVIVGIAALTALASVGEATRQETMRQFKRMLGTFDTLTVRPGAGSTRGMPSLGSVEPSLKFPDGPAIAAGVPGVKRVALVQQAFDLDVSYRDASTVPLVLGVSPNWADIRGEVVASGAHLSEEDDRSLARVTVIGADVARELFHGEDPLGKVIRIADVPFQVKGVMASRGAGPGGASLDNMLVIPVSTASKRLFNRDYLTTLVVQLVDANASDRVADDVRALLRERHRIIPPAQDDFTVGSPRATLAQITQVGSTLSKVVTGVAVIATLIGGAVIMSLMLIGVSERRREIGVRRAVGATRADVMKQFLAEATLISVCGGAVGILIGAGGATVGALLQKLPPAWMWSMIGGAVVLSVAVGVLFGLYPAWKAAKVDPIEALRS
ncbi:MAG TPA: ABC transporter permease [Steroidobacteraceae bacterium]|nr:ABC transporter permease [Steroidobacteraceae bacterium]HQZ79844.1 ABC transporter permease [Steroidobacteraceae bacterium]